MKTRRKLDKEGLPKAGEHTSPPEHASELAQAKEKAHEFVNKVKHLIESEEARVLVDWHDGYDVDYSDARMLELDNDLSKLGDGFEMVLAYVEKIKQTSEREDALEAWLDVLKLICSTPCMPRGMSANDRDGWLGRYGGHWLFMGQKIVRKDLLPALQKDIRGERGQEIQAQLMSLFEREPTIGKSLIKAPSEASDHQDGQEEMGFLETLFEWYAYEREAVDISVYDGLVAEWIALMSQGPKELGSYFQKWFKCNLWIHTWSGINQESDRKEEEFLQGLDVNKEFLAFEEQHSMTRVRELLFEAVFPEAGTLTREQEDLLLSWVHEEDEACLYRQRIAEIMRRGDQVYLRKKLEEIHTGHEARSQRELALSLIRRLDLGDAPVTDAGVEHFGTKYDLGEHNQKGWVVRRLTTGGEIAVFDAARRLDGVFPLSVGETGVKPEVRELALDEVALPDPARTAQKAREQRYSTYVEGIYHYMTEAFFDETAIYPADLSLFEQAALVECLEDLSENKREEVIHFLRRYKLDGVRSLISLRHNRSAYDRLEDLQEVTRAIQDPERIFADHAKLVEFVLNAHKYIAPFLQKKLGATFNEQGWIEGCLRFADQHLESAIHEAKRLPNYARTYDQLRDAWRQDPTKHEALLGYDAITQKIAVELANQFRAEEIRGLLQELPAGLSQFLVPYLQPETPGEAKEDLKALYESIRFESHDLNRKMTPIELGRLHVWLPKGEPVLDAGCGTGRLLVPLAKLGFDIQGFDYTPRHVKVVQEELMHEGLDPARVSQGDWLATQYSDHAFKAVVCLGRNILHEYRLERQKQFFAEMNRILDVGGRLIIDIPDRHVPNSHYDQLAKGYQEAMQARGIHNTRRGTIFDSPDNRHFATRYVYDDADIRRFAKEAGFEVVTVESEDLPTGQGDRNLYYILQKVKDPEG